MDKFSLLSGYHEPVMVDAGAAAAPLEAVAGVWGEVGRGAGMLARVATEYERVRERGDRIEDAGRFEDLKTLAQGAVGKWENDELAAGNPAGRDVRWKDLVAKQVNPLFGKAKFKTPEARERARLWMDEFKAVGGVEAQRAELLGKKERAGKSFRARYDFCLKNGDFNGAREAVATAGGEHVLEPDEQSLMLQEADFKETDKRVDKALQDDPFHGLEALEKGGGLSAVQGRPDVVEGYRKQAEVARRKAQAGVAEGYVLDAFHGREFRTGDLERDVAAGRVGVDDAMSLSMAEVRRKKAVEKMGKDAAELFTAPEDFMRVDMLLGGYRPDLDVDGTGFAEVEREIATAQLSKATRERMMGELKDVAAGRVPERFRGAAKEAGDVVRSLVDSGGFGAWKEDKESGDFKAFERVMGVAYRVQQGLDEWVRAHPGASREEMADEAVRQAGEVTGVKPAGAAVRAALDAMGNQEAGGGGLGAGEVLDDLGVDVNAAGDAVLLPPLDGDWGGNGVRVRAVDAVGKVLDGVSMKGRDLGVCLREVMKTMKVDGAADVAAVKSVVEKRWAWDNR